jgi:fumarate hydratase subunit alpha
VRFSPGGYPKDGSESIRHVIIFEAQNNNITYFKMITKETITETVSELLNRAVTRLPEDVESALKKAYKVERGEIAKTQLAAIIDNVKYARKKGVPICQDTGIPVFYVGIGSNAKVDTGIIEDAIVEGVRIATECIPLRPNAVHPLTRKNSEDNTGAGVPVIVFEILTGKDYIEITVLPKGAGSENMSRLALLKPSDGIVGIKTFVIESVAAAGGNPCPPVIVGVGIGGTADKAVKLSKKALLRKISSRNKDEGIACLEEELLSSINKLGIGPMGLGGDTAALAVLAEYAFCHTASLPVAVNLQCWANRRASARIRGKRAEFI